MKFQKLFLSVVTGCLLLGASGAMAFISDIAWFKVKLESVSGTATAESELCVGAYQELINQGYTLAASADPEPKLTVFLFQKNGDTAALYCVPEYVFEAR